MTKIKDEEINYIKEYLNYDPDTGIFTWKKRRGRFETGEIAGYKNDRGYIFINLKSKLYRAHRIAFLLMGHLLPEQVDHINGDKTDNRWENLRPCDAFGNNRNAKRRSDNTSGYKGVCWNRKSKMWLSQIYVNNKHIRLGLFNTPEEAHEAYCKAAREYFGEFARFE